MSVDITDDELVVTRSPVDTSKPSPQPDTATLFSSSSSPITALKYALSTSSTVPAALMSFSTSINHIESIHYGVQRMRSYGAA